MKKLLISMLCAGALMACSTDNVPQAKAQNVVVLDNCNDARELVRNNHLKLRQAFADSDVNAIGTLQLQNRSIIRSNRDCFPNLMQIISSEKKLSDVYEGNK